MKQPLVLVPTEKEMQKAFRYLPNPERVQLSGFGPIASAIATTMHLATGKYDRVLLLGIAGTYDATQLPVGNACTFDAVACYGIGAGDGDDFQTGHDLKLETEPLYLELEATVQAQPLLLTVTSAAGNSAEVIRRKRKFDRAMAEDMEAWGVVAAARRFDLPVTVIRGISNIAGDRDHERWQIEPALRSAAELLKTLLD
ncbi:MAG: hypothetical protein GY819_01955 [Planctomycetaceae bacterium]|nr:hypothetical protein [Planctomycetaceae bacterium]MCP4461543.1 hypothetical protein [Planctomycetaceae bacterium]MDG1808348.1 hypothetical protein [Pirellulaceae bacterium]MDG2105541.1 hypothetical protein [Pirellulaceae bacterium]